MFEHDEYQNLLRDKVTSAYKKCDLEDVADTNEKAALLAKTLNLEKYIEKYAETPCFLTLKDHKTGFEKNKSTRPINPAKPEIGKILYSRRFGTRNPIKTQHEPVEKHSECNIRPGLAI